MGVLASELVKCENGYYMGLISGRLSEDCDKVHIDRSLGSRLRFLTSYGFWI